ncbi:MAG TPA: hypothetical protein VIM58_04060 [Candidatus Methylacidiphilales bacterium]
MKSAPENIAVRLPEAMARAVEAKAGSSDNAFSRYVRALVEADLERRFLSPRRRPGPGTDARRAAP